MNVCFASLLKREKFITFQGGGMVTITAVAVAAAAIVKIEREKVERESP